jgi:hypothetical protein
MRRFLLLTGVLMLGLLAGCPEGPAARKPDTDESVSGSIRILWDESSGVDPVLFGTELLEARFPNADVDIIPFVHPMREDPKSITRLIEEGARTRI